jgi:hypothetical protein
MLQFSGDSHMLSPHIGVCGQVSQAPLFRHSPSGQMGQSAQWLAGGGPNGVIERNVV